MYTVQFRTKEKGATFRQKQFKLFDQIASIEYFIANDR